MNAIGILKTSFRQVFGNFSMALRVSGLLYAVQLVLVFAFGLKAMADPAVMQLALQSGEYPWGKLALVIVASIVTSLWVVIAWHRFVLIKESTGILPPFHGDRMLAYVGKSMLIGLVLIPVAIPILIVAGLLSGLLINTLIMPGNPNTALLVGIASFAVGVLILIPLGLIAFRLSLILPAASLGETMTLKQSWRATAGATMTLLLLIVILAVATFVIDLPAQWLFGPVSNVTMIWISVTGWLKMMIGASLLATLYSQFIEDRAAVFA